ncbi:hypothetical protein G6658_03795 [Polynucleobacter paneuropaeus]|nr:hypothetical protein G6658_03795 [Polynucleobacter paneuropaeus]
MSRPAEGFLFVDLVPPGFGKPPPKEIPLPLPTTEEIQAIKDKAFADGLESGYKDGYAKGKSLAESENLIDKQVLQKLTEQFSTVIANKSIEICEDVLSLSLAIAKSMVKTEVKVNPAVICPLILEGTKKLVDINQLQLFLNPFDASIVRKYLQAELEAHQWQIMDDPEMEQGGCRLQTAQNSVDASNESRWKVVTEGLGRVTDWHEAQS